jgi:hypothetical protein
MGSQMPELWCKFAQLVVQIPNPQLIHTDFLGTDFKGLSKDLGGFLLLVSP